ncbi:MAG: hypothetical protein MJ214_01070 [Bacilli bacterium]|nr:hypothetical protein [Bacilli bacterium]
MEAVLRSYNAKVDSKNRLTLRRASCRYYAVTEHKNGTIVLSPRALINPYEISENTFKMIKQSVKDFNDGKVSKPIDLSEYK